MSETEDTQNDAPRFAEGPAAAAETLEQALARLQAEADDAKDRALRAQAEMDNVRKRLRREMDEERRFAQSPLLSDLLPVVDNIGRALTASEKKADAASLAEGVKLVAQQLDAVLAKHHCKRIDALGKPFDPNLHAAILQQPSADEPPNTVLNVAQEGYQLHDRVIRPSQVIVSKAAE